MLLEHLMHLFMQSTAQGRPPSLRKPDIVAMRCRRIEHRRRLSRRVIENRALNMEIEGDQG
jgi:hypothetical protein